MDELKEYTIPKALENSFIEFADFTAINNMHGETITYSQLKEKIVSVAEFLKSQGVGKGDKVAIIGENQANWSITYIATTSFGAIAVPIMTEFQTADVHHILRHSGAKSVFVSEKLYEKVFDCDSEDLQTIVLLDDFTIITREDRNDLISKAFTEAKKELNKIKIAAMKFAGLSSELPKEEDLAAIVYTSGTTGHSKGVMLTHKNISFDAYASSFLVAMQPGDRMLSILPLAHTMECTLGMILPLMLGVSINYLQKPPTATYLLPALSEIKPNVMVSVPLVIEKIFKLKILPEINKKALVRTLYKVPTVRKKIHKAAGKKLYKTFGGELQMFCIGGASISQDVERFLSESGFPYAVGYGLTETSPLVTGDNDKETRFRGVGRPIKGVEIKIENPDPETGEGEVLIKGPMVMSGYYKDTENSKAVLIEDGWFRSGDLGIVDKDNYLFIKGRSKNVIIGSNGKNIYPEQIESIINEEPYVLESVVHERAGKIVARIFLNYDELDKEFSIYKSGEKFAQKKIKEILDTIHKSVNTKVPSFSKINSVIEQPEEFEKTPTKKIKRYIYK